MNFVKLNYLLVESDEPKDDQSGRKRKNLSETKGKQNRFLFCFKFAKGKGSKKWRRCYILDEADCSDSDESHGFEFDDGESLKDFIVSDDDEEDN